METSTTSLMTTTVTTMTTPTTLTTTTPTETTTTSTPTTTVTTLPTTTFSTSSSTTPTTPTTIPTTTTTPTTTMTTTTTTMTTTTTVSTTTTEPPTTSTTPLTSTEMPTTTKPPLIPPELPEYYEYPISSDYHFPTMRLNATACAPSPEDIELTAGPFGFGEAIMTNECCPKFHDFVKEEHWGCFQHLDCPNGISLSLWERFQFETSEKERYILSSGGDTNGHAGMAIYHKGVDLVALVSNGTHYWRVDAPGLIENDTWANVGLIWNSSHGLQIYINAVHVASVKYPSNENAVKSQEASSEDKPKVVLGCRMDKMGSDLTDKARACFDELAIWMSSVNDSQYFLGGFNPVAANFTLDKIMQLLKVKDQDLLDKENLPALVKLLQKMTVKGSSAMQSNGAEEEPVNRNGIEVILYEGPREEEVETTTPSLEDLKHNVDKLMEKKNDPEGRAQSLQMVADIIKVLSTVEFETLSEEEFKVHMGLLDIASNIFGSQYAEDWKLLQTTKSPQESMLVATSLQKWAVNLLSKVPLESSTLPRSKRNAVRMTRFHHVKTTTNLAMSAVKVTPNELEKIRGITLPNYNRPAWQEISWNMDKPDGLEDTVKIPEIMMNGYGNDDPGSVCVLVFNTFNEFAPLTVPVRKPRLPDERTFVDGKIISLGVTPEKGIGKQLDAHPFTVTISHVKKEPALRRHLLFHTTDKEIPTVKRRYCARWDTEQPNRPNGTWTSRGCELLVDHPDYTMCDCKHPGMFAIISQEILRKDIVPDPEWLWISKYVGYALSAASLILYIGIVISSRHLKDQFPIMRVHLAVSLLIGMGSLWATDYVRSQRHECTAITAIMQYAYTASGMWLLLEGFALFLAMVCGYVGGRLNAYIFLAWGFPALPLGIAMLADMEDFGLEPRCMISWEDDLKWLFFGPVLASGILGLLFCTVSIINSSFSKLQKDFYLEDLGSVSKGLFCVLVIFITTWSFACLAYLDIEQVDPDFYPIFQVFNSALGLFVFGFMGLGSKKFRLVLMRKMPQYRVLSLQSELVPVKPQPKY